jgi:hypothetical protein
MELHELLDIGGVDSIVLTKEALRDSQTGGLLTCYKVMVMDDNADSIASVTAPNFYNVCEHVVLRTIIALERAEKERAEMIADIQDARKDSGL